jgi:Fe-S cluster assembly ATP-binding protein
MLVFNPKYVILDEIDSGLDVDALRIIAQTVAKISKKLKIGVLVITHYQRILKYLEPDRVVVLANGEIIRSGGIELVEEIEKNGYGL